MKTSEGEIGSFVERVYAFCTFWDPDLGAYAVDAMRVMQLVGICVVILLTIVIGGFVLKNKRKVKVA